MLNNKIVEEIKREYDIERDHGKNSNIVDSYHTLPELYYQRMLLSSMVFNNTLLNKHCWKSKLHEDGTMFDNYFIVGCNTIKGIYAYHYDLKYWDKFKVKEIPNAPEYDGHTASDIGRLIYMLDYLNIVPLPYV